jgi:hypothetical protein
MGASVGIELLFIGREILGRENPGREKNLKMKSGAPSRTDSPWAPIATRVRL